MDFDAVIADLQNQLKAYNVVALQGGPQQALATGATAALLQIAMQLAQLNKTLAEQAKAK